MVPIVPHHLAQSLNDYLVWHLFCASRRTEFLQRHHVIKYDKLDYDYTCKFRWALWGEIVMRTRDRVDGAFWPNWIQFPIVSDEISLYWGTEMREVAR